MFAPHKETFLFLLLLRVFFIFIFIFPGYAKGVAPNQTTARMFEVFFVEPPQQQQQQHNNSPAG